MKAVSLPRNGRDKQPRGKNRSHQETAEIKPTLTFDIWDWMTLGWASCALQGDEHPLWSPPTTYHGHPSPSAVTPKHFQHSIEEGGGKAVPLLSFRGFSGSPFRREFLNKSSNPWSLGPKGSETHHVVLKAKVRPQTPRAFRATMEPKRDTYFCREVCSDRHRLQSPSVIRSRWYVYNAGGLC